MDKRAWLGMAGFLLAIVVLGTYLLGPTDAAGQRGTRLTGVIEGTEVDLSFKMGGTIAEILVKEGDEVKAGQRVAVLNSDELLAKREQTEAAYRLALARLEQAKQGVSLTDKTVSAQVEQAKAAVDAAKAQYEAYKNGARAEEVAQLQAKLEAAQTARDVAATQLERMKALFAEGAVPQATVEEAQMKYEQAEAEWKAIGEQLKMAQAGARQEQLDAAKAQWEQAVAAYEQAVASRGQVDVKQLDVQSAEASVQQAKGALDEIEAYLKNAELVAPMDGVVKAVAVQKGELVAQGDTVVTLQAKADNYVKFYVDEYALSTVKVGDKVILHVPALNRDVTAEIVSVAPAADFAVKKATQELGDRDIRSFQVKMTVSDPELRPGLTVEWNVEGAGGGA